MPRRCFPASSLHKAKPSSVTDHKGASRPAIDGTVTDNPYSENAAPGRIFRRIRALPRRGVGTGCQDRRRLPLRARGPRVRPRPKRLIEGTPARTNLRGGNEPEGVAGVWATAGVHLEICSLGAQLHGRLKDLPVAVNLHWGENFGARPGGYGQPGLGWSLAKEVQFIGARFGRRPEAGGRTRSSVASQLALQLRLQLLRSPLGRCTRLRRRR